MPRSNERLISEVVEAVLSAPDLQRALEALVAVARDHYDLWEASVWVFELDDQLRCVAHWAPGGSALSTGVVIRSTITDEIASLAHALRRGRAMQRRVDREGLGMVGDLLRQEGVASFALMPFKRGRLADAVLALASSRADAFEPTQVRLLNAIARGVSKRVLQLLDEQPPPESSGT